MRVVFFGTPAFAVASLRALVSHGAEVVGVVTRPDRPQGRSRSVAVAPPVVEVARELGIPVLQPEGPRTTELVAALRTWGPDLGVVVAYGHILPPAVLAIPRLGMVNVHASLLPRHRGAAPVVATILAGDAETGVTIMQMDPGMDTGPILDQAVTTVGPHETAGALTERLAVIGAASLVEVLPRVEQGHLTPVPQDESRATFAPRVDRESARVRWEEGAEPVVRRIRAFDPVPGAWSELDGLEVKLFAASSLREPGEPGLVVRTDPVLVVGAGRDAVTIAEVQPSGRRRMPAQAWARGRGVRPGARFS
jgi:methionyl-tRNA formyltransferase